MLPKPRARFSAKAPQENWLIVAGEPRSDIVHKRAPRKLVKLCSPQHVENIENIENIEHIEHIEHIEIVENT